MVYNLKTDSFTYDFGTLKLFDLLYLDELKAHFGGAS